MRSRPSLVPPFAIIVALALLMASCGPVPAPLTPDAKLAFHATRVVKALDVVRDAAIASNETTPPIISTNSTRTVVLWHRTVVQVIQAVPGGWKTTVKASIFVLTCDVRAYDPTPAYPTPPPCTSQLAPAEVVRLAPYVGLVLIVISEVL